MYIGAMLRKQLQMGTVLWTSLQNVCWRHVEKTVADQTCYLYLLQYADTGPTSPSIDPVTV